MASLHWWPLRKPVFHGLRALLSGIPEEAQGEEGAASLFSFLQHLSQSLLTTVLERLGLKCLLLKRSYI